MAWPADKTNWVDGVTELDAWWFNAMEDHVGVQGSTDPNSLTYKLVSPDQVDPGHRHTPGALQGGQNGDVLLRGADNWAPATPDGAGLVAKSGDQTVGGKKTFSTLPEVGADPTADNQLTRKSYVDGLAAGLAGDIGDLETGKMDKAGGEFTGAVKFSGLVGFFGQENVDQAAPLDAALDLLTCSAPGTPDYAVADPVQNTGYGFSTADEFKTVMAVIANLQVRQNQLNAGLCAFGLFDVGIII